MNSELFLLSPIIWIVVVALIGITLDAKNQKNANIGYFAALAGLIGSGVLSAMTLGVSKSSIIALYKVPETLLTHGTVSFGGLGAYFDILFCIAGLLTVIASRNYITLENRNTSEYYNLILFAVAGMMIIAHSKHLLTLFIGIETMSVTFYILSGYFRHSAKSVEASLKYFLLGAFSTGFLLYGMAMLYGATGTMYLGYGPGGLDIATAISKGIISNYYFLAIGIGMMIVGLAFKVAAFPFHQWAPDVYTGAPTVVSAFMSTAGKGAALLSLIIVAYYSFFPTGAEQVIGNTESAIFVIAVISALTMLAGNISALVQKNVKRMLAFSSVAHAGYLLMGIVANSPEGWNAIVYYITAYTFMQIGAFVVVSLLERDTDRNQEIEDYSGLYKSNPVLAFIMAVFMFSLAGIPPMAGFFGKYYLFSAAIQSGYTWLTVIAVISSIISMYFYIGLVLQMYFKDREEGEQLTSIGGGGKWVVYISVAAVFALGFVPMLITDITTNLFP